MASLARRRVCANVEKFKSWDKLKISLQTGCDNHASSTYMHCKSCRNDRFVLEKEHSGVDFSLQVAVQGVKKTSTDHGPCLLYRVSQQDGSVIDLVKNQVASNFLSEFEVRLASRRRQKQTPPKSLAAPKAATVQILLRLRKRRMFKKYLAKRRSAMSSQSSAKSVAQASQSVSSPAKSSPHVLRRVHRSSPSQTSVKLNHVLDPFTSNCLIPSS